MCRARLDPSQMCSEPLATHVLWGSTVTPAYARGVSLAINPPWRLVQPIALAAHSSVQDIIVLTDSSARQVVLLAKSPALTGDPVLSARLTGPTFSLPMARSASDACLDTKLTRIGLAVFRAAQVTSVLTVHAVSHAACMVLLHTVRTPRQRACYADQVLSQMWHAPVVWCAIRRCNQLTAHRVRRAQLGTRQVLVCSAMLATARLSVVEMVQSVNYVQTVGCRQSPGTIA